MISIILPPYNEIDNINIIIQKIAEVLDREGIKWEIIVVDDNSPDGTASAAEGFSEKYPVKVCVRKTDRGLSKAVIRGFNLAKGDICLVMDADLSHPVEKIPDMVKPIILNECDATVGSRNIQGGGCEEWPLLRRIASKIAGYMAKGITTLSDPTSGFMAIRKSILDNIDIDPLGWKIVLEVTVKAQPRIKEIPILFSERKKGKSKLGIKAQIDYLHHLWRLYSFRYPDADQFIKFCLVGISGIFIDTAVLIFLVELFFFDARLAAIFAFTAAVSWNYLLNRVWTFKQGMGTKIAHTYITFVIVCMIGLGVRIGIMHLLIMYAGMGEKPWYILASLLGIAVATIFNFSGSKYIVFSRWFHK
ncbi:MAG TPA: glycosyltransferase family 2 protein [Desulfatiglandales bacterium]|nr:glycosyltransferase family 2 protein [Desulfatiglandales bacterium]